MKDKTLLVIEDEQDILNLLAYNLENAGYTVHKAETGAQGLSLVRQHHPDLVILDLMLPDISGFEICKKLHQDLQTKEIPVIMLTAKSEDEDIIEGLEAGADDYITKPFSPKVLEARIKTVLRRGKDMPDETSRKIAIHGIEIDTIRHTVKLDGKYIDLSVTEFAILMHLATHPGWVFSRNQIIDAVKGSNYPVTERSVDVQILGIRKKLKHAGVFLETVRGIGYKLKEE